MDDAAFLDRVADSLAELPDVVGVALGGSRAQGTNRPDSDWDFSLYYRDRFDPQGVRDLGWEGSVTELGDWGRVFNGGGWLTTEQRSVDIHYRDLTLIEQIHDRAERGEFDIDSLLFHQAGLPSYILLAELGVNRVLRGDLPSWGYPAELARAAPPIWWTQADLTLSYAKEGHARHGRVAQCAGLISEAACRTAHAILAHRREWVTNEKQLLTRAGLRDVDGIIASVSADTGSLLEATDDVRRMLTAAVTREGVLPAD